MKERERERRERKRGEREREVDRSTTVFIRSPTNCAENGI
jgi:hypothetical protein